MMIHNARPVSAVYACFFLAGFWADTVLAEVRYRLVTEKGQPYIEVCNAADCSRVSLPVLDYAASYTLLNLAEQDKNLVFASPAQGAMDVNFCGNVYLLLADNSVNELRAENDEALCNVITHGNEIVSNYRDAAKWYDVVYKLHLPSKKLIKYLVDECVGCGAVARIEFNSGGSVRNHWMMDDANNYWERKKIAAHVVVDRAQLYNSPDARDITGMYLIRDDVVTLKKEQSAEDGSGWFYLVSYQVKGRKEIIKWIEADAVAYDRADAQHP